MPSRSPASRSRPPRPRFPPIPAVAPPNFASFANSDSAMKPPPAHGLVNQLIALTLLLLAFSGSLGLGAVWVRQEISQTANRSRSLEVKVANVERRLDEVNADV